MNVDPDVNYEELARSTDDFNGAQCKAVCVEAGMIALRRESNLVTHEDFLDAVIEVQAKKKANLNYYAWLWQIYEYYCEDSLANKLFQNPQQHDTQNAN